MSEIEVKYVPVDLKTIDFTKNRILVDYLSFSLRNINTFKKAVDLLGMKSDDFQAYDGYYNGYDTKYECNGVKIFTHGKRLRSFIFECGDTELIHENLGVWIEMTGTGCRSFETYSMNKKSDKTDVLWRDLFNYILEHDGNVNRIDLAYDDFLGYLDINAIIEDTRNLNYVTKFRSDPQYSCSIDSKTAYEAYTVYFGSPKSKIRIRIYDKRYQQKAMDVCNHWVRCEIQLRHERAQACVNIICDKYERDENDIVRVNENGEVLLKEQPADISEVYFFIINEYLRFIVPSETDSNRWRAPVSEHWKKFCNSVTEYRISLFSTPGTEYTPELMNRFIEKRCYNAVYVYILVHGLDELVKTVESKFDRLPKKYQAILQMEDISYDEKLNEIRSREEFNIDDYIKKEAF